jgi:hypothetical protein
MPTIRPLKISLPYAAPFYNVFMRQSATLLEALGGEVGCRRLSAEF